MAFLAPGQLPQYNPVWAQYAAGSGGQQSAGYQWPWQQGIGASMGQPTGGYSGGGSFGVGSAPGGYTTGFGVPIGGSPNAGWGEALKGAYNQSQQSYDQALKALGSSFSQGPWGQGLANMFQSPTGISDEAYNGYLRMIRDREAGSRANALESLQNAGYASGFGNSMGLLDAGARLRAQSASNLNDAELQLLMQREQAKLGQQSMAGGLLSQLYGLDAAQQQSLAQLLANRPFQAFAPEQQPTGGGYGWTLPGGGM